MLAGFLWAGVQAAAAKESKEYADQMARVEGSFKDVSGWIENMMKNDPTTVIRALKGFTGSLSGLEPAQPNSVSTMIQNLGKVDTEVLLLISTVFNNMNRISIQKLKALEDWLKGLD